MSEEKKLPPPIPGNRVNNLGVQFPAVDHKGHKADASSWTRAKKPTLRRKHAQQMINAGNIEASVVRMAARPPKKKG